MDRPPYAERMDGCGLMDKAPGINMAESLLGPPLQHLGIHLVLPSNCPRDMPTMLLHYLRGCRGNSTIPI
jgi:hypothetical protein